VLRKERKIVLPGHHGASQFFMGGNCGLTATHYQERGGNFRLIGGEERLGTRKGRL